MYKILFSNSVNTYAILTTVKSIVYQHIVNKPTTKSVITNDVSESN
jgi:hypothetical protein